jgi:hypothetical protein
MEKYYPSKGIAIMTAPLPAATSLYRLLGTNHNPDTASSRDAQQHK